MTVSLRFLQALEPDIAEIMAIFEGRREWLRDVKGSSQWSGVPQWRRLMIHLIRQGDVWVLVTDDEQAHILGTVTISRRGDVQFWSEHERADEAMYVSKLATDVAYKGLELGGALLDHVVDLAVREGVGLLRLDTWKTAPDLHDYYRKRGWGHVRTAELDHRESGDLFECRIGGSCGPTVHQTVQRPALTTA